MGADVKALFRWLHAACMSVTQVNLALFLRRDIKRATRLENPLMYCLLKFAKPRNCCFPCTVEVAFHSVATTFQWSMVSPAREMT